MYSLTRRNDLNVGYRGQTGKHLLVLSFTGFDPLRTYGQVLSCKRRSRNLLAFGAATTMPFVQVSSDLQSRSSTASMIRSTPFHQITAGILFTACQTGVVICQSTESR